jgi:hypothetical protein
MAIWVGRVEVSCKFSNLRSIGEEPIADDPNGAMQDDVKT